MSDTGSTHDQVVKDVGLFGLKTLLIINGGAIIVIMSFMGNIYGQEASNFHIDMGDVKISLLFFTCGIILALSSALMTYIFAHRHNADWVNNMNGTWHLIWMAAPALFSCGLFVCGVVFAICALT